MDCWITYFWRSCSNDATADSQLLVSTSAISEDLKLNKVIKTRKSNKLTNTRYITIILGLFAYATAMYSEVSGDTILELLVLHGAD